MTPQLQIKWNCARNIIWKDFNINSFTKFLYYQTRNCCYYSIQVLLLLFGYAQKFRLLKSTAIVTQGLSRSNQNIRKKKLLTSTKKVLLPKATLEQKCLLFRKIK